LVSKLGLRVLRHQLAFGFRRLFSLNRRGIGFGIEGGELVVGFAGARYSDPGVLTGRGFGYCRGRGRVLRYLRNRRLERRSRFGLSGLNQVGDRSVAGRRL
jgi:hypothetical protein